MNATPSGRVGKRHQLRRKGRSTIPPSLRITTTEDLKRHLQFAIKVEHATIPPYLCVLYSIRDGYNVEAAKVIRSVVLEEMLHMILAANVLNAIESKSEIVPGINDPEFIPTYPGPLPHSDPSFIVNLEMFSPAALETFLKIEQPEKPKAPPEADNFHTIAQFYEAIELALLELSGINVDEDNLHEVVEAIVRGSYEPPLTRNIFAGDFYRQITPEYYYGGGGEAIPVTDLRSALRALYEITGQGEGLHHTIWDGDEQLGEVEEPAHYFRFNEIAKGRRYQASDSVNSDPSGEKFVVDWDQVYPMQPNPKMANYRRDSALWRKTYECNRTYTSLLNELNSALNGSPQRLMQAVVGMYDLKYQAVELMKIPIGDGEMTAGPSFEYVER